MPNSEIVLKVEGLCVYFDNGGHFIRAVDGVELDCWQGQTTAILGESGSGKTITAKAIMGLIKHTPGVISGRILFGNQDLTANLEKICRVSNSNYGLTISKDTNHWHQLLKHRMAPLYGRKLAYIFQEPTRTLDPLLPIGKQIERVAARFSRAEGAGSRERVLNLLECIDLKPASSYVGRYPYELSTGQCQRLVVALVLLPRPRLIIADEPTSSLDVLTQKTVLDYLRSRQIQDHFAIMLITHSTDLVREYSQEVVVLFAGRTVERIATPLIDNGSQLHPYTEMLVRSESVRQVQEPAGKEMIDHSLTGCIYRQRCHYYRQAQSHLRGLCESENPPLISIGDGHQVACWKYQDSAD
ncbi:MAG: ABC transporter ATP-binding protein [candidate division Zixibacteria bacterium]|nr:ABC transporter ATP-binding protein [candidate division Zixibacteria bacterium]